MKMKKITAREAARINRKNGIEQWNEDGQKTYWASPIDESGTYFFDSARERNEFVERHN